MYLHLQIQWECIFLDTLTFFIKYCTCGMWNPIIYIYNIISLQKKGSLPRPINTDNLTINTANDFIGICLLTHLKRQHVRVGNIIFRHLCKGHHPIFCYRHFMHYVAGIWKCRQSIGLSPIIFLSASTSAVNIWCAQHFVYYVTDTYKCW